VRDRFDLEFSVMAQDLQLHSVFLTEKQASAHLCVSLSTLRRWRRNQVGPTFFRMGDVLRYEIKDLEAFIAAHRNLARG
jgi:hypothetical protein